MWGVVSLKCVVLCVSMSDKNLQHQVKKLLMMLILAYGINTDTFVLINFL